MDSIWVQNPYNTHQIPESHTSLVDITDDVERTGKEDADQRITQRSQNDLLGIA